MVLNSSIATNFWLALVLHGHKQHVFVQYFVMFHIVQERTWDIARIATEEHCHTRNSDRARLRQTGKEWRERQTVLLPARQD